MPERIKIGERSAAVEADALALGATARVVIDKTAFAVEPVAAEPHRLVLRVNGRPRVLSVVREGGKLWVGAGGAARMVEPERRKRAGDAAKGAVAPATPGVVARMLVEAGQRVARGEALAVVTAMKMETTLRAPADGTVRAVLVQPGEAVRAGQPVVDFVPDPEAPEDGHART